MDVPETDELLDPVIVNQQLNELTDNYTQREIIDIINNHQRGQASPFRMIYLFVILLYLSRSIYIDYNLSHGNNYRFTESIPIAALPFNHDIANWNISDSSVL